jgi:hypothetical protein
MDIKAVLLAEYAEATTGNERAEIELQLWNNAPPEVRKKKPKREDYVSGLVGAKRFEVDIRLRLLAIGDGVDELWKRQDEEMPLRTAHALAQEARKTKAKTETMPEAVDRVLREYDARPVVRHLAGGKIVRQHSATDLRPRNGAAPSKAKGGNFWMELRALIGPVFEERLEGLDPALVLRERKRFVGEIQSVFEVTQSRLNRLKSEHATEGLSPALAKRRFTSACHTLKVDPPRRNQKVDKAFFDATKKQFKRLASEYHPDRRGSDVTRPQYEAVLEAWDTVEHYFEHYGHKENDNG